MQLDLSIRIATIDDLSFIIKSWVRTQSQIYPNNFAFDFYNKYNNYVKSLLDKSVTLVSCLSDSQEDIVGYLVYTSFDGKCVIHFSYVRPEERKVGICNSLIQFANIDNTPIIFTSPAKRQDIMKHLNTKYIFDPSLVTLL